MRCGRTAASIERKWPQTGGHESSKDKHGTYAAMKRALLLGNATGKPGRAARAACLLSAGDYARLPEHLPDIAPPPWCAEAIAEASRKFDAAASAAAAGGPPVGGGAQRVRAAVARFRARHPAAT